LPVPPSVTDNEEYYHQVAPKYFTFLTPLGQPTSFLTFTMNPHWADYQAVKRGRGTFAYSTMTAVTQHCQILGKFCSYIEDRLITQGIPRACILCWSDCDTQGVHVVEEVVNARYSKDSPFIEHQGMASGFNN
jgi:hypothetical protein